MMSVAVAVARAMAMVVGGDDDTGGKARQEKNGEGGSDKGSHDASGGLGQAE